MYKLSLYFGQSGFAVPDGLLLLYLVHTTCCYLLQSYYTVAAISNDLFLLKLAQDAPCLTSDARVQD